MAKSPQTNAHYGQEPKASPAVRWATVILGLILLGLAFVAGREVWRILAAPEQQSWTQPAVDVMSKPGLEDWMLYAAAGAIVVGLICLFLAFKPRRSTHVSVSHDNGPSTWIRHVDVARRSSAIARNVPGVASAHSTSKNNVVTVTVNGDVGDSGLAERVSQAVSAELSHLARPPRVNVKTEQIQGVGNNV
ncbi:DUF6286 domain-containing protein [Corynebacterium phocae]|uniref:DUF6286 domain-containing protein n=1 Tax=Corynebacterium phocae TaxID=161895 RepID=UPI00123C1D80|nr:DUF6286 domain-containing protein [Corynebacterium phocae]KAA8721581.1 hypothetical protein F4V58_10030 [Corynebacterium phocae]